MASSTAWRVVGIGTYQPGADLELTALHLYAAGERVDEDATLTCSHVPTEGDLEDLQTDTPGTACRFNGHAVRSGGFYLRFDFDVPTAVRAVRLGSGASASRYVSHLVLQYLSDGRWLRWSEPGRFAWPGAFELDTAPAGGDDYFNEVRMLLTGEGAHASTVFTDASTQNLVCTDVGGAQLSNAQSPWEAGSTSIYLNGACNIAVPASSGIATIAGDFCLDVRAYLTDATRSQHEILDARTSGGVAQPWVFYTKYAGGVQRLSMYLGGLGDFECTIPVPINAWTHLCVARWGGTLGLFVDGELGATFSIGTSTIAGGTEPLWVGGKDASIYKMQGYLADLRYTDVARDTASFTVPSTRAPRGFGAQAFEALHLMVPPPLRGAVVASAAVGSHTARNARRLNCARDVEFGGPDVLSGTVERRVDADALTPQRARVSLLRARDKALARVTWSDPETGAFEFAGVDTGTEHFITLAEYPTNPSNPHADNYLRPAAGVSPLRGQGNAS